MSYVPCDAISVALPPVLGDSNVTDVETFGRRVYARPLSGSAARRAT